MKDGVAEEGEREKERAFGVRLRRSRQGSGHKFIRNAAALAAARPTLLFNDWKNAARLNRNDSDEFCCDGIPVAVKCASVSLWACRGRWQGRRPCSCSLLDQAGTA